MVFIHVKSVDTFKCMCGPDCAQHACAVVLIVPSLSVQ